MVSDTGGDVEEAKRIFHEGESKEGAKRRCFTESSSPVICLMLFSGLAWGYGLGEEALRGKGPSRHIIRSTVTCHFLMSTLAAWPGDVLSGFLLPTLSSLEG